MFLSRVFTLYPDYFPGYLNKGLFGKSKGKEWNLEIINIRDYALDKHKTVTNGGRVLSVVSSAKTMNQALKRSYETIDKIEFEGKVFRKDIGFDL